MSVYARFKKDPDGFRHIVELLESTPASRRQKMIDVGMQEDADYTKRAIEAMFTFHDVMKLPDMELSEMLATVPGQVTGYAIHAASQEVKDRFISQAQPRVAAEIKEYLEMPSVSLMQIGGAQLRLIEAARKLERQGLIKTKHIPQG